MGTGDVLPEGVAGQNTQGHRCSSALKDCNIGAHLVSIINASYVFGNLQFLDFTITECILRFQFYFCHNFEAQWFSFLCGPDLYRCGGYVAEACLRIRSIRKRPLFKMWGKAKKKLSVILIAYQDFLMNELWWQNDLYKSII